MDTALEIDHPALSSPQLDDVDRKIIKLLQADPRTTNRALASEIGVSESTIAHRIRTMSEKNLMRVVAQRDYFAGQFSMVCLLEIGTAGQTDAAAEALTKIENMVSVARVAGDKQILANIRVRDWEHLNDVIANEVSQVSAIDRIETNLCLRICKWVTGYGDLSIPLPAMKDEFDDALSNQMMRLLGADARTSNRELARQLNVSHGTVRNRLNKLMDANEIQLVVVCDGAALSSVHTTLIKVATKPEHRAQLIEELSAHEFVPFVATMVGAFDLWFVVQSQAARDVPVLLDELSMGGQRLRETSVLPLVESYLSRYDLARVGGDYVQWGDKV